MDLTKLTIVQAGQGLRKKEFSAVELCQAYLDNIEAKNKDVFAFLTIIKDLAMQEAKKADDLISSGAKLPALAGIPMAVKDNILVKGVKCTAGSKILEDYMAPYDATVVSKLKKQGVIILGKTNLDEFAMGSSTENSAFGPTRNPHNLSRVPGGSSGGSAAAVAGDMSVFALGSDTGGSIRQPASFCGLVGLKPTYGAVSRYGLMAFASSLDQIGPITKTAEDAKIVFEAISGKDKLDSTSVSMESSPEKMIKPSQIKAGIPREYFIKGIDPEVEKAVKSAIEKYEKAGVKIIEVSLPNTQYALPAYYIINPAEASSNLARYDGIKYGLSKEGKALLDVYLETRGQGFGAEVRRRIMLGTFTLSSGYYEAYYKRAQKVRTKIIQDFKNVFNKVDVLFTPTCPILPFKIGEKIEDPLSMYLVDVYTVSVNLAGLPALSLPIGQVNNLPVGMQIIGQPFEDIKILELAKAYGA
ncbi:MAG: Asp-tRNA(Asn)/Glu-tRNA(Gln) amidotransferase subunit GatA [Candidatus Nealsonbacteria bacterium]|nr:Asp-tRNA(Asn)/Glu-tRNA(Gln) amidotransferase subunit GatA [Candidatus Nealsonbacteria bacterium]